MVSVNFFKRYCSENTAQTEFYFLQCVRLLYNICTRYYDKFSYSLLLSWPECGTQKIKYDTTVN